MATAKPKKEPAIPLNEMLLALDRRDRGWYSRLTDEQKKAIADGDFTSIGASIWGKKEENKDIFTQAPVASNVFNLDSAVLNFVSQLNDIKAKNSQLIESDEVSISHLEEEIK